ncbi:exonuclease [Escherichia coli]|nr:hypothetical protein E1470_100p00050 [Escherichia coli ECC-1470]BEB04587.1 hypothetical protein VEE33_43950 [Escherichia coli]GCG91321.1 exonuclease [Escherichia coli]GCH04468.1 exonuclease [Escherichia coli]GCI45285.1 exonuclease [Escherichia coli]
MMEIFWTILASQAGLTWEGLAHSAIADARMTAGVVNAIAAYHPSLMLMYAYISINEG